MWGIPASAWSRGGPPGRHARRTGAANAPLAPLPAAALLRRWRLAACSPLAAPTTPPLPQSRSDYAADDVEHYFNYMGCLAVEGTYDRFEEMMASGAPGC